MHILWPVNEALMIKRGHDVRIVNTCHALASVCNHQVTLLVGNSKATPEKILAYYGLPPTPNLHIKQIPILRHWGPFGFSWHGVYNFFSRRPLQTLMRENPPDIVYLSSLKLARFLMKFPPLRGVPFAFETHAVSGMDTPGEKPIPDPVEQEIFGRCRLLVTTTQALADLGKQVYGNLPFVFAPLGTTPNPEMPAPYAPPQGRPPRLCYFGQMYHLQGVDLLIAALKEIPQADLHLIGGSAEDIAFLRQTAEQCGVTPRVVFHGFVAPGKVYELSRDCDVLVVPSRDEGRMRYVAHMKIYQYMQLRRPIVAADLPSIREDLAPERDAALFPPGDVSAMASAIKRVLSDETFARKISENAFKRAPEFTWSAKAKRLTELFASMTKNK